MNGAYLHLAINHIPVLAAPFGFLFLAAGLLRKSRDLVQAGFVMLILVGIVTYPALRTGGMAARMVHNLPGVEGMNIRNHALAADYTEWPSIILGVLSLFGLWKSGKSEGIPMGLTLLALIGSLFLSTIMVRVAHLGGLVRHPEIASDFAPPSAH